MLVFSLTVRWIVSGAVKLDDVELFRQQHPGRELLHLELEGVRKFGQQSRVDIDRVGKAFPAVKAVHEFSIFGEDHARELPRQSRLDSSLHVPDFSLHRKEHSSFWVSPRA